MLNADCVHGMTEKKIWNICYWIDFIKNPNSNSKTFTFIQKKNINGPISIVSLTGIPNSLRSMKNSEIWQFMKWINVKGTHFIVLFVYWLLLLSQSHVIIGNNHSPYRIHFSPYLISFHSSLSLQPPNGKWLKMVHFLFVSNFMSFVKWVHSNSGQYMGKSDLGNGNEIGIR